MVRLIISLMLLGFPSAGAVEPEVRSLSAHEAGGEEQVCPETPKAFKKNWTEWSTLLSIPFIVFSSLFTWHGYYLSLITLSGPRTDLVATKIYKFIGITLHIASNSLLMIALLMVIFHSPNICVANPSGFTVVHEDHANKFLFTHRETWGKLKLQFAILLGLLLPLIALVPIVSSAIVRHSILATVLELLGVTVTTLGSVSLWIAVIILVHDSIRQIEKHHTDKEYYFTENKIAASGLKVTRDVIRLVAGNAFSVRGVMQLHIAKWILPKQFREGTLEAIDTVAEMYDGVAGAVADIEKGFKKAEEFIVNDVGDFFKDDVAGFFVEDVGGALKDLGGDMEEAFSSVSEFFRR